METIVVAFTMMAFIFSVLAFVTSVVCFIKLKASELSKHEFIAMDPRELFETDVEKINQEIKEDETEEEFEEAFEGKSTSNRNNINGVIL